MVTTSGTLLRSDGTKHCTDDRRCTDVYHRSIFTARQRGQVVLQVGAIRPAPHYILRIQEKLPRQIRDIDAENNARDRLKTLVQTASVREYVAAFDAVLLDIPTASEDDMIHAFVYGLRQPVKGLVKATMEKTGDNTLEKAQTLAVQFAQSTGESAQQLQKQRRFKPPQRYNRPYLPSASRPAQLNPSEEKAKLDEGYVFYHMLELWQARPLCCTVPCTEEATSHAAASRSRSTTSSTYVKKRVTAPSGEPPKEICSISSETGLYYLELFLKNGSVSALVDTGASVSFISSDCAAKLRVPTVHTDTLSVVLPNGKKLQSTSCVCLSLCFENIILEHNFHILDMA